MGFLVILHILRAPMGHPPITHDPKCQKWGPQSVLLCPKSPFIPFKIFLMEVIDDIGTKKEKIFFFIFGCITRRGGGAGIMKV